MDVWGCVGKGVCEYVGGCMREYVCRSVRVFGGEGVRFVVCMMHLYMHAHTHTNTRTRIHKWYVPTHELERV